MVKIKELQSTMLIIFCCFLLVPAQTFQIKARQSRFLAAFFDKIQRERATERQTGINDLDLLAITAAVSLSRLDFTMTSISGLLARLGGVLYHTYS